MDKHLEFFFVCLKWARGEFGGDYLQRFSFFCQHALWQENEISAAPFPKERDFCLCLGLKPFEQQGPAEVSAHDTWFPGGSMPKPTGWIRVWPAFFSFVK